MAEELPVIDPTKNVLDLVRAETKRLDDIRAEQEKTWAAKFEGIRRELDTAERLRIEQKADNAAHKDDQRQNIGVIYGAAGLLVAGAALAVAVFVAIGGS